jgi:Ca-activated chloride channel homolog
VPSHTASRSFLISVCFRSYLYWVCAAACVAFFCVFVMPRAFSQSQLPYMNSGPNSAFAQVDFSQVYMGTQVWDQNSINSGAVSMLDMSAPQNAVQEFNRGADFLKAQDFKEATRHLQKALEIYPKFVSARIALGLAYLDQQDPRAKEEFQSAAALDDRFPSPFVNLGVLALEAGDFATAESNLTKAASLLPGDPKILTALAFAENGDHKYQDALQTVARVHARRHHEMANVHYIGAAAAMALNDPETERRELNNLVTEDPANPLAPIARKNLERLAKGENPPTESPHELGIHEEPVVSYTRMVTFPNNDHLKAELKAVSEQPDGDSCESCGVASIEPSPSAAEAIGEHTSDTSPTFATWQKEFTIHQAVDETALFFSVSSHGHMINDLSLDDIRIRDDNKAPDKILQFVPQSKLPLRLALLIDSSDSVRARVQFERQAAKKFLRKVLNGQSDLAFVAGFNNEVFVTQDFTRDALALDNGIDMLGNGGNGTAMFDAVYYACWKLAAFPDEGRVAKVLVILTDGEDNSSHRSLKQAIEEAEAAGVTVYTIGTSEMPEVHTDANNILKVLGERTGGGSIFPGDLYALDHYLNKLPDVIRSRYLVAYKPAGFEPDGKYRPIQVKAEKDGHHLHVNVRKGYYARIAARPALSARR